MILIAFVLLLPLFGFLLNGIMGRRLLFTRMVSGWLASTVVGISFLTAAYIFFTTPSFLLQQGIYYKAYDVLLVGDFILSASFLVDSLSLLFVLIITGVGFLIHIFSILYMDKESGANYARYFSYLNLFIFFMLVLVLGANLFVTFIGWEGVGLCSYLLIGFWFKNPSFVRAANKAFIMNRIGDLAFLLASFMLVFYLGSIDYEDIDMKMASVASVSPIAVVSIAVLLFFAATGKSAQLPLFTWLPSAMAGPTPVSALIHAATMVTGGIYLVSRCHTIFDLAPFAQHLMLFVGIVTAFIAATTAMVQQDIKKVLAYSTVSQLGFMVAALGAGAYVSAIFHVMTHAFFKALLFLASGSIIYTLGHEQRLAKMGGLRKKLPITHATFLVACLAISGIPPFSGFFSKDEILLSVFNVHLFYYIVLQLTAALTVCYMFRLYALTFLGSYRGELESKLIHDPPRTMTIPLIILAFFAFFAGWLGMPPYLQHWLGSGHLMGDYLFKWLSIEEYHIEFSVEMLLAGIASLLSLVVGLWSVNKYKKVTKATLGKTPANFWLKHWHIDELYQIAVVLPLYKFASFLYAYIESRGILKVPARVEGVIVGIAGRLRFMQRGYLSLYFFWTICALCIIFTGFVVFLYHNYKW